MNIMIKYFSILLLLLGVSCKPQKSIIKNHVSLEISTYEDNGITKASAMPALRQNSEFIIYKKRFDYLLMNVSEIHSPNKAKERMDIWKLYPDTIELNRLYLNKFIEDKKLVNYFEETAKCIQNSKAERKISFTDDELMNVASKFFYCDKVMPDTTVQAHICIGLNGIKEAKWSKDFTLLEAFCFEGIFNDLDKDTSLVWDSFGQLKNESSKKYRGEIRTLEEYLEKVKLDVFDKMKNNAILKKELLNYYELNKTNLAFKIENID